MFIESTPTSNRFVSSAIRSAAIVLPMADSRHDLMVAAISSRLGPCVLCVMRCLLPGSVGVGYVRRAGAVARHFRDVPRTCRRSLRCPRDHESLQVAGTFHDVE